MSRVEWDADIARRIIASHGGKPERLVQILVDFVRRFGWIPDAATQLLADALNLSRADVHGVISYYHDFRTTPPGQHCLKICQAEACRAVGAVALTRYAESQSGLKLGESNGALSLDATYCLGNCALGPAAQFDGNTLGRVDRARLDAILRSLGETVT